MVAPVVFARVKSSRNRFRRFETSSRVNAFRAFALLEFVPMSFPARAFASCTPARTLVVSFRARGKKTSEKTVLLLCCFRVWRERRACTVPLCARHVDIIFPYEVEHIGNRTFFSTFVTHRNTYKHTHNNHANLRENVCVLAGATSLSSLSVVSLVFARALLSFLCEGVREKFAFEISHSE